MNTRSDRVLVPAAVLAATLWPALALGQVLCLELNFHPDVAMHPHVSNLTALHLGNRCEVDFTFSSHGGPEHGYEEGEQQQIRIRAGLPLNSLDGGLGGVEGAWNGRTRNLGGGVCVGSVGAVTSSTSLGYVGSSTDSGHAGSSCGFALEPNPNRLNRGRLKDFISDSLVAQVSWAQAIAKIYYGLAPVYNYWDSCSTGGRQGLTLAQVAPHLIDGYVVGAPAINWGQLHFGQAWGPVARKDRNTQVATAKMSAATSAAIAACDGDDGVVDGLLADPRKCTFSATANICGEPTAPPTNCLTPEEAGTIDLIWDGGRNAYGKRIYPPLAKGASLTSLNGSTPFSPALWQIRWNHEDAAYDWMNVTLENYAAEAELGANGNGGLINTNAVTLEPVRDRGAKILMWHGVADPLITAYNSLKYYIEVAAHFATVSDELGPVPDFDALQPWFRYFWAPGVGHCGGGAGPSPQGLFDLVVDWVENGVAPDSVPGSGGGRTRPLCPFPQEAIYDGIGDPNDAGSFSCGGNLQTQQAICEGLLVKYQQETGAAVDEYGGTYNEAHCLDTDGDSIADGADNCPLASNSGQEDADADGVGDACDNCSAVANADQCDTNNDGYGNQCDPDLNDNGVVNFEDLAPVKAALFSTPGDDNWNPDADLSCNGVVNFVDLGITKEYFFGPPGPSATVAP